MATDHRLQIVLAAKDITGAAFTKFQGRLTAITKSVFSFKGALGALTGAGGLGVLVTRSLETADAIAKTAVKLGLSTDALQEYRYAAERSGVATGTLDTAMQRFTRRVAEAAQGKGELRGVLEQYSIAVRDAAGHTRDTRDVFRDLADTIQRSTDPAERLRVAFKAFDSEGAALVNMLRDGSAGLDAYATRAHALGVVIDKDLVYGSGKAKDAMEDLGKVIQTNFSRVVLENVNGLTAAVENMAGAMGKVAEYANLRSIFATSRTAAKLIKSGHLKMTPLEFDKMGYLERQRLVDRTLESLKQIERHEAGRRGSGIDLGGLGPVAIKPDPAELARFSQYGALVRDSLKTSAYDQTWGPGELARMAQYDTLVRDSQKAYETMAGYVRDYAGAAMNAYESIDRSFDSVAGNMSSALSDFVTEGKLSFKGLANSIISDIVRIQSKAAISGLFGKLEGSIGGIFGAGASATGHITPHGAWVGAGGTTAVGFHTGGEVGSGAGTLRRVPAGMFAGAPRLHHGLASDEYPAILQQGETVIPKGGARTINVYNISTPDVAGFVSWLRSTGAVPVLAAEDINHNGLLRNTILDSL